MREIHTNIRKEGEQSYQYQVEAGNTLIGNTCWVFKNSWGTWWGNNGFGCVVADVNDFYGKWILNSPVEIQTQTGIIDEEDILCLDLDGDGFFNWGIGPKPLTCPECPDEPDCDDSDPLLGPFDDNYNCSDFCTTFYSPKIITSDETWTNDLYFNKDIIIESGVTLTVNSMISLSSDATIIVEAGGKLIVDGGTLTNACELPWQGIEVWGNSSAHQFEYTGHPCAQGKLYLKNNAVIENALTAVTLCNPQDPEMRGGIIIARDSDFKNNQRAVEFVPYQNFSPGTGEPTEYISYFKNCDFVIDDNNILPGEFEAHITLQSVYIIDFKGCRFSNNITDAQNTGNAILSIDAGFWVTDYCSGTTLPCPPENYFLSEFNNFYAAIEGYNEKSVNTVFINDAVFNNNSYGVKLGAVNNATIINSEFNIGPNTRDENKCIGTDPFATGIELTGCTGFAIEENTFSKTEGAPNENYVGIYIAETQATDEVYKNTFDGLKHGNYAVGKNWLGTNTWQGLAYYCNENTGNYEDFKVVKNTGNVGGIQDPIGSVEIPAGNTFSSNANYNINNDGNYGIVYYYYAPSPGNTNTPYYPDEIFQVTREEVVGIQNECPSHYGGGAGDERGLLLTPGQKLEAEQEFATGSNDYTNIRGHYMITCKTEVIPPANCWI